ncbi:conserved hypothetical Ustilaginaceae_specific protein [Sporisorium reilianum SRZ2]|uniref:Conserved hypothetical Ustilaginaceae_specific protein n=1 Tax=Sporisorium reilianum (strain SRZ2) TaxID=999809 RepID=E7A186_SPORE|nr:conserved hypothetical Ustilaginaceae_specific protein [Sporisorium reilianum SRZ2]
MSLFKRLIQAFVMVIPFLFRTQAAPINENIVDFVIWQEGTPLVKAVENLGQYVAKISQQAHPPAYQRTDVFCQFFKDMRIIDRIPGPDAVVPHPLTGFEWDVWYPNHLERTLRDAKSAHIATLETHAEAARMRAGR